MANGIFDTFTGIGGGPIIFPDQSPDLPPPGDILDEGLAELAQRAGIDITAQEAGDLRETALAGGNVGEVAVDIASNMAERKRDNIINSGLASVVPELLSPLSGVNQAVGVINTADYLTNLAADFAQDVPVAGPLTAEAADFTGDLSQLTFDVTNPLYQGIGFLQNRIIDPITGRIRNVVDPRRLFNFFRRDDDIDPIRANRPVVVVDPNAVSQTFTTGGGSTPPPVVVTDTQKPYESGVGQQTGQTGGPAGMGFAPPPPSNNPTGFGSNIRIGKAEGGLATIPRYLKGR